jgi:hypothetical protein
MPNIGIGAQPRWRDVKMRVWVARLENQDIEEMLNNGLSLGDEGYSSGAGDVAVGPYGVTRGGKSNGTMSGADGGTIERNGRMLEANRGSEDEMENERHISQTLGGGKGPTSTNGAPEQPSDDTFLELPLEGLVVSSPIQNEHWYQPADVDFHNQINQINQTPDIMAQHGHDRLPSISQIQREGPPTPKPTYVRALSSHTPESVAPPMTPGEARTEVLRRLGRATSVMKTLKRRGSNESLSSLISYSIRRPSMPSRPESGYSLAALAHVLEDVASEGDLPLVEATMALGANPNFRSVNRLKNRRHNALIKATFGGHVEIMDYLLRQGATYDLNATSKSDPFGAIDYKLLDATYAGQIAVARYLIANQGANPLTSQWPRAYFDANRTIYRRVAPAHVSQRSVLHALSKTMPPETSIPLLASIIHSPDIDLAQPCWSVYSDAPHTTATPRMTQMTSHYSTLSLFVKAGWFDAVALILGINSTPSAYEKADSVTSEEGQIPSSNITRWIAPAHALSRDTWLTRPDDALRILKALVERGFDVTSTQRTPDDSAPRSPLSRAILANAHAGVSILLKAHPDLVEQDVSFRVKLTSGEDREYIARPLAAAILLGSLDSARVLLDMGANVHAHAFGYSNITLFAAATGVSGILTTLLAHAPELRTAALHIAITKLRVECVSILLHTSPSELDTSEMWNTVLSVQYTGKNEGVQRRYERILEMVYDICSSEKKGNPSTEALRRAVEADNIVGLEKCVNWGLVERNEVAKWCQAMGKEGGGECDIRAA